MLPEQVSPKPSSFIFGITIGCELILVHSAAPQFSHFEHTCKSDPHGRGFLSDLYKRPLEPILTPQSYIVKWEGDLDLTLEHVDWTHIWEATKLASQNIVALETNHKVLHTVVFAPASISKFLPQYPSQ